MPTGTPLTYESMMPELSSTTCKIRMPSLSENIKADKRFMKHRLGQFYDICVNTRLKAPGNEKADQVWTEEGTGLKVLKMELKSKSKKIQIGDYQIEYSINGGPWFNSGLVLERKGWPDFKNTVLFRYDKFMAELEDFENDDLLFKFRIIVEGIPGQILNEIPFIPSICKCCNFCEPYHNNKKKIHNYYCTFEVLAGKAEKPKLVEGNGNCIFCVPHKKTDKELDDIRSRLRAIIEDFESMGYHISFYEDRETAMSFVKEIAKFHFVANYERLMLL
jgi:hypothetical protein